MPIDEAVCHKKPIFKANFGIDWYRRKS